MDLLAQSSDGVLDLNLAAETLQVLLCLNVSLKCIEKENEHCQEFLWLAIYTVTSKDLHCLISGAEKAAV